MNSHLAVLPAGLLALTCGIGPAAEEKSAAAAKPPTVSAGAGLLNDWLRQRSTVLTNWDIGGQIRLRFEHKDHFAIAGVPGSVDFRDDNVDTSNSYLLFREKLHLGYTPCDWVTVFAEARDSSTHDDDRDPSPEADVFDLHQGFVALGNAREFPLTAKVGRQELNYGDERLVGGFDWNNIGRVFDAAKFRFQNDALWVDSFVSRVVIPYDGRFNVPNDYDVFHGVYASSKALCPKQVTELYFLGRNVSDQSPMAVGAGQPPFRQGASPRDIYTFGLRFKSLPGASGGWDYDAELAGQFGRFKETIGPLAGRNLDHKAFAAHVAGGYTWKDAPCSPRVGLEYNYASGDNDSSDGDHQTFDNLFPTNHKFYGYMDFFSWQNLHNVRLASSLKPHKKLTLTADYHLFWLAETGDFFYQANGAPRTAAGYGRNAGFDSFVGSELDVLATYAIRPFASAQVGYGHFFLGNYVKDSLKNVGSSDADFVYVQLLLNF